MSASAPAPLAAPERGDRRERELGIGSRQLALERQASGPSCGGAIERLGLELK
jgi:hypothetical protein